MHFKICMTSKNFRIENNSTNDSCYLISDLIMKWTMKTDEFRKCEKLIRWKFTVQNKSTKMDVGSSGTELLLGVEECEQLQLNGTLPSSYLSENISQAALFYNSTIVCLDHAPILTRSSIIRGSVLSVLAVLSFVGNIATIYSIRRSQRSRRASRTNCSAIYSLILQLSVADLLVTVFCLAGEAAWSFTVAWLAGNVCCKIFKFLQMFSLYLSTFVLVLIGVDRFVAVRFPMKNLSTGSRGTNLLIIMYILSGILSIPQVSRVCVYFLPIYYWRRFAYAKTFANDKIMLIAFHK